MGNITVNDYISDTDTVVYPGDVDSRIEELKKKIREAQQDGGDPSAEDEDELAALIDFRDDAQRETGKPFNEITIVPEDTFEDFAEQEAREIENIDFLAPFVDWERYGQHLQQDYRALDFGDDLVFIR